VQSSAEFQGGCNNDKSRMAKFSRNREAATIIKEGGGIVIVQLYNELIEKKSSESHFSCKQQEKCKIICKIILAATRIEEM
jgi:hypothetical protein